MDKLKTYPNITGDDYPFATIQLKYVPEEYTFKGLTFPTDKPLTLAVKDKLVDFATRYYRNHEIVGSSVADFFDNLQVDLDMNIDTFEKMMEVYNEDIAKPTVQNLTRLPVVNLQITIYRWTTEPRREPIRT